MAGNIPAVGGPGSYDQPVFLDCIIPYFLEKCNPLYEKVWYDTIKENGLVVRPGSTYGGDVPRHFL